MILSYSTSTNAQRMTAFQIADCRTLGETQRWILSHAWSPIVWSASRHEDHFLYSDFCVLDFDDGKMTIEGAKEMIVQGDYAGIIGTTKSHTETAPRFRVVIPWAGRIVDLKTFKQNMKRMVEHVPGADPKCKDGARFYWPCTEIVFYRPGRKMDWLPYTEPRVKARVAPSKASKDAMQMPPGFWGHLKAAAIEGNRNSLAYWAAQRLKENGFRQVDVENILVSYINLDANELNRTISSAFKTKHDLAPR